MRIASIVAAVLFMAGTLGASEGKIGVRLREAMKSAGPSTELAVWVFFTDKGTHAADPGPLVSAQSLARRAAVLPADALVDETDMPVRESYVRETVSRVVRLRQRSKWFNAVSATITPGQASSLIALPFVREVELMARSRRSPEPGPEESQLPHQDAPRSRAKPHTLNYGPSLGQAQMINVPPLHDAGLTGEGVTIAVFDNGFRLLEHEALTPLNIIATYDFVDGKVDVKPENPSSGFGAHGINCLSLLAGNAPGKLIGPAFGASFILIRSENDSSETPTEEDYWVAGIEWADSIGVHVTSTSLGYLDYSPPHASWTWEDMDGQTTVITRAAALAASKGIVVVNSASNQGFNASHNTLSAPADADSILAVGSVSANGLRSGFSSVGPTTDGRIKPDVMAQGSGVTYASAAVATGYESFSSGTSFSTPQVAGVAALLLEARPGSTPADIIGALRATASNSLTPDNLVGWGTINAEAALADLNATETGGNPTLPAAWELKQNYPNPFPNPSNPSTTIAFDLPEESEVALRVFNMVGQQVRTIFDGNLRAGSYGAGGGGFRWSGLDDHGQSVASGVYVIRMEARGLRSGSSTVLSRKMMLIR
jgi:subtilisin family serine protease